ncbi:MAG TPA: DUF86 domain-containing protein [Butyricimonas virosa]|uniref:DUF86 domain-containing protein n=1 Tax=Butyricimonas virosa TaxID=544645 RepID=A0A921KXL0_9BACT|nr:DUF86 domain-containing protein [Butyricimonas virosa]
MCDKRLVLSEIGQIIETIDVVLRRTRDIRILNDFLLSESGMILLDSVCMKLIAIGESVKKLDRLTNKDLLRNYSTVDWKGVMAMRDIIVHHYFEIDAEIVFQTIHDDLPLLREVLFQVKGDMELSRM